MAFSLLWTGFLYFSNNKWILVVLLGKSTGGNDQQNYITAVASFAAFSEINNHHRSAEDTGDIRFQVPWGVFKMMHLELYEVPIV